MITFDPLQSRKTSNSNKTFLFKTFEIWLEENLNSSTVILRTGKVMTLKLASTKWKNIGVGLEISRLVSSQYIQEKSFQAKKIIRTMFFIFFWRKSAVKIGAKFHNCSRASLIRSGFKTKGANLRDRKNGAGIRVCNLAFMYWMAIRKSM